MGVNRRQALEEFLRQNPDDAFARYGLAMDLMNTGEDATALEQFAILEQKHPDYVAGVQQAGQLLLKLGRRKEAGAVLQRGLAAAGRRGDGHAQAEIQGLLDEIVS